MGIQATATIPPPAIAPAPGGMVVSLDAARRRRSPHGLAVRVMVVARHALVRAGLRRLLEDAGFQVLPDDAPVQLRADVVVVDAGEAMASVQLDRDVPILVLCDAASGTGPAAALRDGASGLLLEDCDPAELASAVRTLAGAAPPVLRMSRRPLRECGAGPVDFPA
jgi:DNA-binding NarL/FixJ family response regulator